MFILLNDMAGDSSIAWLVTGEGQGHATLLVSQAAVRWLHAANDSV